METLSMMSKYNTDVIAEVKDAQSKDGAILVINLAADDADAPINEHLVKTQGDKLVAAAKNMADGIGAEEIYVVAPDGIKLDVPNAKTVTVKRSLVLREESALYNIIATGELRSCPLEKEFPSEGLEGKPTVAVDGETLYKIGNGESYNDGEKLISIISENEKKIVSVKVGTKLSEVLDANGLKTEKPILLGGVTGRFVAASEASNTEIGFDALYDSVTVLGDSNCAVDLTMRMMGAAAEESCTKCVICREGTWHLFEIMKDIVAGKGKKDDLDMVLDIGPLIHLGSFCSFGKNMANVATSSVELNKDEFMAHIQKKQCPAGVCAAFNKTTYCIDPTLCTGCGDCEDECPEMAIEGKSKFIYMIDQAMCTGCGDCVDSCDEDAIIVNDGKIKLPKKLTKVGKF